MITRLCDFENLKYIITYYILIVTYFSFFGTSSLPYFFPVSSLHIYYSFIYLLCVLHVTEATREEIPSIIGCLCGCSDARIESNSEIDVNLSQGLRQSCEISVKYQSVLNSFPSESCVCFIPLF